MPIDVVRPRELSREERAAWTALQTLDPTWDSPFLSPGWALAIERAQGGDQSGVRVAVLRETGRPVGFFPARVKGAVAMPAGAPMSDYQAVVAAPEVRVRPQALVDAFGAGRLDFCHMLTGQTAFQPHMRGDCVSYLVDVGEGYAAYEAARRAAGSGVLKDIDKRRRKVEREVGPTRFTAGSRSREDFETLMAWKRRQLKETGQTDVFTPDWTRRLLDQLFEGGRDGCGGALFTLHIGDKLAAVHFHLHGARTIHAWIIAHDEAFEKYSPGLLLFQDILRWMDKTPYSALDLGPGDYRFKQQLSNRTVSVAHGFVGRLSPVALIRSAEYGVRAAAERLPLGRVSQLPAKAMRRLDQWRGLN